MKDWSSPGLESSSSLGARAPAAPESRAGFYFPRGNSGRRYRRAAQEWPSYSGSIARSLSPRLVIRDRGFFWRQLDGWERRIVGDFGGKISSDWTWFPVGFSIALLILGNEGFFVGSSFLRCGWKVSANWMMDIYLKIRVTLELIFCHCRTTALYGMILVYFSVAETRIERNERSY